MEVVEFEANRAMGMVIHDGAVVMNGHAIVEATRDGRTHFILNVEFPGMDESMDANMLSTGMQQRLQNIKQLVESEI